MTVKTRRRTFSVKRLDKMGSILFTYLFTISQILYNGYFIITLLLGVAVKNVCIKMKLTQ